LAVSLVQIFGYYYCNELFESTIDRGAKNNDFKTLPELHGISSGMKALYTGNTHVGID